MRKYIITGGAGFIGSNLAKRLIARGDKVFIIDNLSSGFERNLPQGVFFFKADVSNTAKVRKLDLPAKIDAVYHLAAQSSGESSFNDPLYDIDVNYKATYNLLKLAEKTKCRRFIFSSSMSVYGEMDKAERRIDEEHTCIPVSYYGCNKFASERLIQIFTRDTVIRPTIFRLFTVYGPGQNMFNRKQGMVSIYLSYLLEDKPVLVKGSLERFRDFIYVEDVLDVLISCEMDERYYGEIFNLGTGVKTTIRDLLVIMLRAYGKKDFRKWVKVRGRTPGDITGCVADIAKLRGLTGWSPKYKLEYGVKQMKLWLDETSDFWLKK